MSTDTAPATGSDFGLSLTRTPAAPIGSSYTAARPWLKTEIPPDELDVICET
jgi:hypothetical protein